MRHFFSLFALYLMCNNTNAQSIISTANSKSGILVGSETAFAGISYENASDKFSFNYKLTKQDDSISKGDKYPNFWGINIGTGIKIDKSKAALVTDEKWQGGVDFDITIFRTWDHTTSLDKKESENGITQNQAKIIQKTLYLRLSNSFERFRSFESFVLNADTTFITLKNPLQNNFTGTIGFYTMYQLKSKYFFSYALSANLSSIKNSTTKLTETNLTSFTGLLFNSKDSTKVLQTAKQETYFAGKPEFELFFVPRADVFFRYKTGTGKPVLGFLFSYSPLVSSFKSVKIRNCFAIGPTFGLDIFTDQVLFAIMNEFVQDKKGYYKYALTFHASFPIIFK